MIDFKSFRNITAAYSLWLDGICIYVGATTRLRWRVQAHTTQKTAKLKNTKELELQYTPCNNIKLAHQLEWKLIGELKPLLNKIQLL